MAEYTMTLNDVVEHHSLQLAKYPIFEEAYRDSLNEKIVDHYRWREIGQETVEMFNFFLGRKMNEIMPYYNKLYKTEQLNFDPLKTISVKTVMSGTDGENIAMDAKSTNVTDTTTSSDNLSSQFPQTSLQEYEDYATSGDKAKANVHADGSGDQTSTTNRDLDTKRDSETSGFQAYPSLLLTQYRQTLLNIDMMVVNELGELFMPLFGNSEGGYFNVYI